MLLPDKAALARLLTRYRTQERSVLAQPHRADLHRALEDTAYTLCVLMDERTVQAAVRAAERYLGRAGHSPVPERPPARTEPGGDRRHSSGGHGR
ncbi:DUF5133 domain-containing protein [Streptomyces sp. ASQP_92]|uniref:DUF5133 domain-containing protein n=1 Tax=Streptomyces sp. ASQP_92 TaxID=2979116 RepID=UPI0021BEFCB1|nr:DUF5133 domain-containing protein [Streptomyces sp. ASQP_92]MCT9092451.1 DUF5133 domain-containing protein [Streptomyces sp. ASQP_92]